MLKELGTQLKASVLFMLVFTLLCGLAYPGLVTALAKALFPGQAEGSLITVNGKTVGSSLIGQPFDDPKYFWGRPSATSPYSYNAANSSGSNLGPTNPALISSVQARVAALKAANPDSAAEPVPMDLVTASGSGLDPHISPAGAEYQAARVAKARNLPLAQVESLIAQNTQGRWMGFIGDPGVNVLELNLALDAAGGAK
ncbi:MAG TPA: potassium-transporting ATPase subunit KdpC [bacterium]|jgi:K+-transporting ATPase ATPase C chain|nr:potassium-transporting ATPase subunit KdpC [bacterium]